MRAALDRDEDNSLAAMVEDAIKRGIHPACVKG